MNDMHYSLPNYILSLWHLYTSALKHQQPLYEEMDYHNQVQLAYLVSPNHLAHMMMVIENLF